MPGMQVSVLCISNKKIVQMNLMLVLMWILALILSHTVVAACIAHSLPTIG